MTACRDATALVRRGIDGVEVRRGCGGGGACAWLVSCLLRLQLVSLTLALPLIVPCGCAFFFCACAVDSRRPPRPPTVTGANDVANSIGPFSSIYQLYHHRGQLSTFMSDDFEAGGVFSGGRRDGTPFAAGSPMVDGASFCGSDAAGVGYYACRPAAAVAFPAVVPVHPDATTAVFDLYDAAGALTTPNVTCASRCSVANYAAYASVKQEVPLWILAMGGAGIVLGLAMWGYRIIVAIGMKLTKLTPSRGFAIEVGAAVTVILASRVGLPVSTTHCQVGSTIGVGVVELKRGTVNWKQFAGIFAGWVFTVIATGTVAAAVFSFAVFSPSKFASPQDVSACPGDQLFAYDQAAGVFNGIACSGASVS